MGTYYEIRCMDCDESGGVYADRAKYVAEAVLAAASTLAHLAAVFARDDVRGGYPEVVFGSVCRIDLDFFAKHSGAGHRLTVVDGYGIDEGQCRKGGYEGSGRAFMCALDEKHEGPCSAQGPHARRPVEQETPEPPTVAQAEPGHTCVGASGASSGQSQMDCDACQAGRKRG